MLIRRGGGWTFRVAGEPDSVLSFDATNVALRAVEIRRENVDRALVALSTALGIETLPAEESLPLLAAHHRGLEELPTNFGGWGAVQLEAPDPAEVDAAIGRGCVGISLLCWSHDHDTGFHDHDLSAGAVAVVSGSVREERLVLGRPPDARISRLAPAGSSFYFGASDIHRVLHAGSEPAVTIHATRRRWSGWAATRSSPAASSAARHLPRGRAARAQHDNLSLTFRDTFD